MSKRGDPEQVHLRRAEPSPEVEEDVGPVFDTALAFCCVIGDPQRFSDVRSVGPCLGLVVRRGQSGRMDSKHGTSTCGNSFVRGLLVQCANQLLTPRGKDRCLRRWGLAKVEELGEKSKNKVRIAMARKLAFHLQACWKRDEPWVPILTAPTENGPSATIGVVDCVAELEHPELATSKIEATTAVQIQ